MFLENKVSADGMSAGKGSALPSSIGSLYNYIKNVVQGDGGMFKLFYGLLQIFEN